MIWETACRPLDLTVRGVIMGILNVTPDSFSDGGNFLDVSGAVRHGLEMLAQGAGIIDIGGESTRPGAVPVSADEEMGRVLPVIDAILAAAPECLISVDTSKAAVAEAAVTRGAAIINDVTALRADPAMATVAARSGAGVVLMHMQGTPRTMQENPTYRDVTGEVRTFFEQRLAAARAAGIDSDRIAFDPGIGFGKTVEHNLTLLRELTCLADRRPAARAGRLAQGVFRKSDRRPRNVRAALADGRADRAFARKGRARLARTRR